MFPTPSLPSRVLRLPAVWPAHFRGWRVVPGPIHVRTVKGLRYLRFRGHWERERLERRL